MNKYKLLSPCEEEEEEEEEKKKKEEEEEEEVHTIYSVWR